MKTVPTDPKNSNKPKQKKLYQGNYTKSCHNKIQNDIGILKAARGKKTRVQKSKDKNNNTYFMGNNASEKRGGKIFRGLKEVKGY